MSKIHVDKDPSLKTYFAQEALKARGFYHGALDNWEGPATEDALEAAREAVLGSVKEAPATENLHRDISQRGRELIQHFESGGPIVPGTWNEKYLTAYLDDVGVWTIGYGHTGIRHNDGTVRRGRKITLAEAEALFSADMDYFEGQVMKLVTVPLNDDQFAALVSFAFNCGEGNLKGSTLLRLLNKGDYEGAAAQFIRWNRGDGRVLSGLTRRRKSETNLFRGMKDFIVEA